MVAAIVLDVSTGPVGQVVEITGSGYAALDAIDFEFNGSPIIPTDAPIAADAMGDFVAHCIVPATPKGATTFVATDQSLGTDDAAFTVETLFVITEATAIVGDVINFTGTGFNASEAIDFTFASNPISPTSPVTSDGDGSFTGTMTVPAAVNGNNTVVATDQSAGTDSDTISIDAHIEISPSTGIVGDTVTVTGTGFATESAITVDFDGADITPAGSPESSIAGSFSIDVIITDDVVGIHPIAVEDAAMNTDSADFTLEPSITLNPTLGEPATEVIIQGHGFTNAATISVKINELSLAVTPSPTTVGADGTFECVVTTPSGFSAGTYTIAATDSSAETASETFTIIAADALPVINSGPMSYRKIPAGHMSPPTISVDGANYASLVLVDNRNYEKTLVQIQNIDDAHTGTFNIFGSIATDTESAPSFNETTWTKIGTDTDIANGATKSFVITDPYTWLVVAGKMKTSDPASANVFVRGINNGHNS